MSPIIAIIVISICFVNHGFAVQAPNVPKLPINGKIITVPTNGSIQAALDSANPNDTIVVPDGTFVLNNSLLVNKSSITLRGGQGAILDATGLENAIVVGVPNFPFEGPTPCPKIAVRNFRIEGFTIRNATVNGILLVGVSGFVISNGNYVNSGQYGIFPYCSQNGLIQFNTASGASESAIIIANDINVTATSNVAMNSTIGIDVENGNKTVILDNIVTDNRVGILVSLLGSSPAINNTDTIVVGNWVFNNNNNNTKPPINITAELPLGSGIAVTGGSNMYIAGNTVTDNDSFGIVVTSTPPELLTPPQYRIPFNVLIEKNTLINNGKNLHVTSLTGPSGGDLVMVSEPPSGTCQRNNTFSSSIFVPIFSNRTISGSSSSFPTCQ